MVGGVSGKGGAAGGGGPTAALQKIYALFGLHSTCVPDLILGRDSGSIVCLPLQGTRDKLCCLRIVPCTARRGHLILQRHAGMTTPGNHSTQVLSGPGLLRCIGGTTGVAQCCINEHGHSARTISATCVQGWWCAVWRPWSTFDIQLQYPVWIVTSNARRARPIGKTPRRVKHSQLQWCRRKLLAF